MAESKGFWSYVHADNAADGGRIIQLANDLAAEYEMQTGESLQLFLDAESVQWGDEWRRIIDEGLAAVAFFVPVLTPRYFMRAECRRELGRFAEKATSLGLQELVLPLLYVDVPALETDEPTDELVALVKKYQWVKWTELRLADRSSEPYRKGVADLATRLVAINTRLETSRAAASAVPIEQTTPETDDDAPGTLEQMQTAEDLLPQIAPSLDAISETMNKINQVVEHANNDLNERDRRGAKAFASRLIVSKQLAQQLMPLAELIVGQGSAFAQQLYGADAGVRAMIALFPATMAASPEGYAAVCSAARQVRSLASTSQQTSASLTSMLATTEPLTRMSRDLRPPIRRLRQGLTTITEAMEVTGEWQQLIDTLELECGDEGNGQVGPE